MLDNVFPMHATQIFQMMTSNSKIKKIFKGILAYDQISYITTFTPPSLIILNTGTSKTDGEHWLTILRSNNTYQIFDSLAMPIQTYTELIKVLKKEKNVEIKLTPFQIQETHTPSCGYHCVFFSFLRLFFSEKYIFRFIYCKNDLIGNDILATTCVKNWFPRCFEK